MTQITLHIVTFLIILTVVIIIAMITVLMMSGKQAPEQGPRREGLSDSYKDKSDTQSIWVTLLMTLEVPLTDATGQVRSWMLSSGDMTSNGTCLILCFKENTC